MRRAILCSIGLTLGFAGFGLADIDLGPSGQVETVGMGLDADIYQPNSAVNFVDDHFLLIWSQDPDDLGFQIAGFVVDAAISNNITGTVPISSGPGGAIECAAAFDPILQRYLVVWSQDADAPGAYEIHGALLSKLLAPIGAPFKISAAGANDLDPAFDAIRPSVAADEEGNFLVLWSADDDVVGLGDGVFDLYSRKVSSSGVLHGAPNQRVTDVSQALTVPTADALEGALAFNPVQENFAVYYEADLNGGVYYDPSIYLLVLDKNGTVVAKRAGEPRSISGGGAASKDGTFSARSPDVAYDRRQKQMLVVWEVDDSLQESIGGRMIYSDYSIAPAPIIISELGVAPEKICIARDPSVAYSLFGDSFVVAWAGSPVPAPSCPQEREILLREVDNAGVVLGFGPLLASATDGSDPDYATNSPDIFAYPVNDQLFVQWSGSPNNPGEFDLYGTFLSVGVPTSTDPPQQLPRALELSASPNPFNPATTLRFGLPKDGPVRLAIYDLRGALVRVVVDQNLEAGYHERRWNGTDERGRTVASGVYYTKIEHAGATKSGRVVLVK